MQCKIETCSFNPNRQRALTEYPILNVHNKKVGSKPTLCDHAGARTQDPILKRDVLYLLSYVVINLSASNEFAKVQLF